jgi:hypothetical protein
MRKRTAHIAAPAPSFSSSTEVLTKRVECPHVGCPSAHPRTCARNGAVRLADEVATWAGVPDTTTRPPPSSPAPGPMSMTQSLAAITRISCSTRMTVLPASTNPSSCAISLSTSEGCGPGRGRPACWWRASSHRPPAQPGTAGEVQRGARELPGRAVALTAPGRRRRWAGPCAAGSWSRSRAGHHDCAPSSAPRAGQRRCHRSERCRSSGRP